MQFAATAVGVWNQDGTVDLKLRPALPVPVCQPGQMPVPSVAQVKDMVDKDGAVVHASRNPLIDSEVKVEISNIQGRVFKKLHVIVAPDGGWSQKAWDQLKDWLQKPKRNRAKKSGTGALLALPAPPVLVLPAPAEALLALPVPPEEDVPTGDAAESDGMASMAASPPGSPSSTSPPSSPSPPSPSPPSPSPLSPSPPSPSPPSPSPDPEMHAQSALVEELKKENQALRDRATEAEDHMSETEIWARESEAANLLLMSQNQELQNEVVKLRKQIANEEAMGSDSEED